MGEFIIFEVTSVKGKFQNAHFYFDQFMVKYKLI